MDQQEETRTLSQLGRMTEFFDLSLTHGFSRVFPSKTDHASGFNPSSPPLKTAQAVEES
jgi:hypothetical protein